MTTNSNKEGVDEVVDVTGSEIDNTIQLVTAEIVGEKSGEDNAADIAEPHSHAVRELVERQLVAGHRLSGDLIFALTDATAAVVETPAKLVAAIREGNMLPTALDRAGETLQDTLAAAGGRVRSAVGDYVTHQAALPSAVLTGAAEVAGSVVRAQGAIAGAAVNGVLAVATEAARAGDVRRTVGQEWRETTAVAKSARADILDAVAAARQGIRDAAPEPVAA